MAFRRELDRIRTEYARRSRDENLAGLYTPFQPGHLFTLHNRERVLLQALKRHGYRHLRDAKILDVGSGQGHLLLNLVQYGASPGNLTGVDLLGPWLRCSRQRVPGCSHVQANGGELPFRDRSFDLVLMFTVLTSVLDPGLKWAIAAEARRVVARQGRIVLYDFKRPARNPHIRGVSPAEVRALFPDMKVDLRTVSLAMPLAWRLAPRSWLLCALLERVPLLKTHYLATIYR